MATIRSILLMLAILLPAAAHAAETRIALVIGNSDYASGPLPNPANDAKLIGDQLTNLGFDVIARRNADQTAMKRAIQEFGARLEKAGNDSVGLFYYAGHGVQLNGKNYLIPTTARIEREGDVEIEAVSADWVIEQMRYARNRLNIVILDACRNNPFTRSMRSVDHGLATMDAPAGILIAYSTAPGSVAADGNGRNSPYTEALATAIRDQHEPVEQVFKHVRVGVMNVTSGKQVPWESSSLTGDFYFAAPSNVAPQTANALISGAVPARGDTPDAAARSESPSFGSWMSGLFGSNKTPAPVAAAPAPAPAPTPAATPAAPPVIPPSVSAGAPKPTIKQASIATSSLIAGARALPLLESLGIEVTAIDAAHNYPQAAIRRLIDSTPRRVTLGSTPEQIRAALVMCRKYSPGCKADWYGDEGLRNLTLDPFELDAVPVSVGDFRQFVANTRYKTEAEVAGHAYAVMQGHLMKVDGGSWRNGVNKRSVSDDSAVVGVTFQDAVTYCRFRGRRLPNEDEWEYIARGPKRQMFPWGESVDAVARAPKTAPRADDGPGEGIGGRYKGLSGNVWQWVDTKVGSNRILKGGSWLERNLANQRAAARRFEDPKNADEDSGFRCAKTVASWPDAEIWLADAG